jgi:uncharacterized membrane protein
MNWLVKNFLRGLVIIVPIAVTIWVVYHAFTTIDQLLAFRWPGAGVGVILLSTIAVGALASNYVIRKFLALTHLLFTKAPLVRIVYASIKDLLEAFVGEKKRFDRPVAVALSEGVTTLGFVTQHDLSFLSLAGRVAVYVPFSYSVAGVVLVVPASSVTILEADSASIMALVVSGGISRV